MTTGPSMSPAAISPTTLGWPTWRSTQPQMRAVLRMTMSCSRSEVADMEAVAWGERSTRC